MTLRTPSNVDVSHLVRSTACCRLYAAWCAGRRCVLLTTDAPGAWLEEVVVAHTEIRSPHIAPVVDHDTRAGYVVFASNGVADLELITDAAAASGVTLPYAAAVAFNDTLLDALLAAHDARGGPYCAGALGWRNVLLGAEGELWLFGLGHNYLLRSPRGGWGSAAGVAVAPELAVGDPPTVRSDVYAAYVLIRSLLLFVDVLDPLAAAARGDGSALEEVLSRLTHDVLACPEPLRVPSIAALRARYREVRDHAVIPDADHEGLARFFREMTHAALGEDLTEPATARMRVDVDMRSRTIHLPDRPPVDLSNRKPLWRILVHLMDADLDAPTADIEQLCQAGWPGERLIKAAGRARVHVALSTLRKLGLRELLERSGDGYRIVPHAEIERVENA